MNQRLLERLKRHGEFPQLRPGVVANGQRGSIEPFSAAQPRLTLSKQSSLDARPLNSSRPLEPELGAGFASFAEPDFSRSAQAESLPDATLDVAQADSLSDAALNAAQVGSAALEDFAADDRSNFFEDPFSLSAQTAPTTNTETTIDAPLTAPPGAVASLALSTTSSANHSANSSTDPRDNSSANQLEALTGRNPQTNAQPRFAEPSVVAQPVLLTPPTSVVTPSALESQLRASNLSVNSVSSDTVSADTVSAGNVNSSSVNPRTSEPFTPRESAEFGVNNADIAMSTSDISNALSSALDAVSTQVTLQADSEVTQSSSEPASAFDRKAAMLELRELGVKVRVTLSNAALETQLQAARTSAPRTAATAQVAGGASGVKRNDSAASTLETPARPDQSTAQRGEDGRLQPTPSTAVTPRALDIGSRSPVLESSDASTSLEPASVLEELQPRLASPDASSVALTSKFENPASSETRRASAESSAPFGGDSALEPIARNGVEPAVNATVAAIEVYDPPNRRAVTTRPKVTESPKNEAEVLFSTLPDSNPLEWFSRLNSVQALETDSSNLRMPVQSAALSAVNQTRSSPEQLSSALGNAPESPGSTRLTAAPPIAIPLAAALTTSVPPLRASVTSTAPISTAPISTAPTSTAPIGTLPVSAERANAPLLPNLEAPGNPEHSPQLESVRPTALVAARVAPVDNLTSPGSSSRSTPQEVAGLAPSASKPSASEPSTSVPTTSIGASPATPVPAPTQRQAASAGDVAASRTSGQESLETTPERANALTSEFTARRSDALEVSALERNAPESDGLGGAQSQTNAASNSGPLEEGLLRDSTVEQDGVRQSMPRTATEVASGGHEVNVAQAPSNGLRDPLPSSQAISSAAFPNVALSNTVLSDAALSSAVLSDAGRVTDSTASAALPSDSTPRTVAPSDSTSSLGERGADASRPASAVPPVTAVTPSASVLPGEKPIAASSNDVASQGTVVAVEVYDPPNRRAVTTRPKVTESPKNEAEVLFSTLPDSNPLEWFSRLNSVQALETDSSNLRMPVQSAALSAVGLPNAADAASRTEAELGLRASPDVSPARVAKFTAQTDSDPRIRVPVDPGQGTQPSGLVREPDSSAVALGAQPLAPNAQTAGVGATASLIATPPSAAPRPAVQATNLESFAPVTAQPVRLSSSAQRLIAPITGIDPSTVQIRRDAQSDALTKAYRADALTVNGTVLLSARLGAETPETLGVIAHELTHVARERSPRFVPPALRQSLLPANRGVPSSLDGQGEESIALQVEGFTRALAQQGMTLGSASTSGNRPTNGAASLNNRSLESVPWGDGVLPAPWELADRLEALTSPGLASARRQSAGSGAQQSAFQQTAFEQSSAPQSASSSAFTRSDAPAFAGSSSNSSAPTAPASAASFAAIGGRNAPMSVQAAEQGRSVPTPSPAGPLPKSPEAVPKPASGAAPAPDLDDLARQVYAVLKRRLITERRRSS